MSNNGYINPNIFPRSERQFIIEMNKRKSEQNEKSQKSINSTYEISTSFSGSGYHQNNYDSGNCVTHFFR